MKLCKDCKHYSPTVASLKVGGIVRQAACGHPNNINLVHGGPYRSPEELRYGVHTGACKEQGLWWESK